MLRLQLLLVATTLLRIQARTLQQSSTTTAQLPGDTAAEALRTCYNEPFDPSGLTFEEYVEGKPTAHMRMHRVWWSPRRPELELGIYTMTDLSRLERLAAQCRSLPGGVISVAVWLPLYEPPPPATSSAVMALLNAVRQTNNETGLSPGNAAKLAEAEAQLDAFFKQIEDSAGGSPDAAAAAGQAGPGSGAGAGKGAGSAPVEPACSLRLLLIYEVIRDEAALALFPINTLRNAALLALETPLVASMDVDFAFNVGLLESVLMNKTRVSDMVRRGEQDKNIFVMPAWETGRHISPNFGNAVVKTVLNMRPKDKPRMRDMWLYEQLILPYHADTYKIGQQATNYEKWLQEASDFKAKYEQGYEPWFIIARKAVHPHDLRFRGRGFNKVAYMMNLHLNGYQMYVLSDGWIMHRPHAKHTAAHGVHMRADAPPPPPGASPAVGAPLPTTDLLELTVQIKGVSMKARDAFSGRNFGFYTKDVERMVAKTYKEVTDPPSENCRAKLSWWQGMGTGQPQAQAQEKAQEKAPAEEKAPAQEMAQGQAQAPVQDQGQGQAQEKAQGQGPAQGPARLRS